MMRSVPAILNPDMPVIKGCSGVPIQLANNVFRSGWLFVRLFWAARDSPLFVRLEKISYEIYEGSATKLKSRTRSLKS